MAKKKHIKFQYFVTCGEDIEGMPTYYDLSDWIDRVNDLSLKERQKDIGNIKGRLECIRVVKNDYIALNFVRLDDSSNDYKVKSGQEAEHIDLDDDEYIGKNTVLLYDRQLKIAMIQVSRGCYGVQGIENYINSFNTDILCYLRPIDAEFDFNDCLKHDILKLDIRFANVEEFKAQKSKDFEAIINSCNNMYAKTAHVEIGLGKSEIESLNNETICNVVEDVRNNKQAVSTARIKISDDNKSAIYDMFENIEHDFIQFTIPPRGELGFDYVSDEMGEKYIDSYARIYRNLKR